MNYSTEQSGENNHIIVEHVAHESRMGFLPSLFGVRAMLCGEAAAFAWARSLSKDYAKQNGGFWEFYKTSNGSGFMVPDTLPDVVEVSNGLNFYSGSMSKEALGIACTILALGAALERFGLRDLREKDRLLKDYAEQHPESSAIFRVID